MQEPSDHAHAVERALADTEFDGSPDPVICFEVDRSSQVASLVAPVWVAISLSQNLSHAMASAHVAMVQYGLDTSGFDLGQHVAWGASEDDDSAAFKAEHLDIVRQPDGTLTVLVRGLHASSGTAIQTYPVPFDRFVSDIASGRRAFGHNLTDDELLDEAAPAFPS